MSVTKFENFTIFSRKLKLKRNLADKLSRTTLRKVKISFISDSIWDDDKTSVSL